ncbi:MAG: PrsW family intramembrane metalloprotease [Eubacterium sp.]|nr:PrsW family intramembrane metalloprotease [Eubacterium sp.]MBQ9023298.1 PrsW family intramembrane metalloprotease [Eubacterium sp.]
MIILQILLLAALLPPLILLFFVWKQDTIEKEPIGLLVKLFVFGCLTTFAAMILEMIGERILAGIFGGSYSSLIGQLLMYFIVVAWSEEGVKRFVLRRTTWKHPAFDYRFDGIVYAVAVSLGFAALENIEYVFSFGGLAVAGVRAITAIPLHCIAGIFMGHYYGEAKMASMRGDTALSKRFMFLSLLVPILIHGFYDFCATQESGILTLVYWIFVVVLDIIAFRCVKKYSRADMHI